MLFSKVNPVRSLESLNTLRTTVSLTLTWFLQGSKFAMFFFMVYITYRYGHIHLGHKDDKPEYSTLSYFCMSFATGVGPATLFYCVQEPLLQQAGHFYEQAGYRSQDEVDMFAINITVSNWGTPCWTHYAVVAVCMSLAMHRFNLPFTYRSCFYPIFGAYTWGWIGDFIDGLTIVVTCFGACTNLGLTAILVVTGLTHSGWIDKGSLQEELSSYQSIAAWLVTIISTMSVMSGVRVGMQVVSNTSMALGCLLLILVFFMDDTKFLLNIAVQEIGLYLQTGLFQLNSMTDAFGQLPEGAGRAIDGKAADQMWMT
jgi:choline/glycine/proline betaine transport protein